MSSIHNIPEPTTAYRPAVDEPAPTPPPPMLDASARRPDCADRADTSRPETEIDEEVGGFTWLVVLLISGVVSRLALWFFGPWQGLPEDTATWAATGHALLHQGPAALDGAMPVYPLLALGLDTIGLPLWALSAFQALLGVVAIAAGYHLGHKLTGRCLAGIGVAALLALHPGVLTWTLAIAPGGLAAGLVMLGLYLLVHKNAEKLSGLWPATIVLMLAALTAPAAWLVGIGAALWCLAKHRGRHAILSTSMVLLFTVGTALTWSALSGGSIAPRWVGSATSGHDALPRITQITNQSLQDLGAQLRFNMQPYGALAQASEDRADLPVQRDIVADLLGETWVALNTAILLAGAVGLGLLVLRGRCAAAACIAVPVLAYIATGLPLDEPTRIALIGPTALLAFGWLSTRSAPMLTPEQREALVHEKELRQQAKLEQRQLKRDTKHGLYAFDKPKKKAKSQPKPAVSPESPPPPDVAVQPEVAQEPAIAIEEAPPAPAMMRPI